MFCGDKLTKPKTMRQCNCVEKSQVKLGTNLNINIQRVGLGIIMPCGHSAMVVSVFHLH